MDVKELAVAGDSKGMMGRRSGKMETRMHHVRFCTLWITAIGLSLFASACCHRVAGEKSSAGDLMLDSSLVRIVGTVYVTGNEPFAKLAIEADSGKVYVIARQPKELYDELWKLQGTKVELVSKPDTGKSELGEKVMVVQRYKIIQ